MTSPRTQGFRGSRMGSAVDESATLRQAARVAALRAAGQRVYNFTVGEPDCEAPAPVLEAAHRAIDAGDTHYTPSAGLPDLRASLAAHYRKRHGLPWEPEQTLVATGAKQVLWNALATTVDPGDEVVLFAPYWTSYPAYVRMLGATVRVVTTHAEEGFKARPEALRAVLGPRTRAVLFNNPSNPTGAVYTHDELRALFEPLFDHEAVLLSDEIYERLVFEGQHVSVAQALPELADRILVATGASKSYAMTGWRIGFGLGPAPWIEAMTRLQSHVTGNANSVAQRAAQAALQLDEAEVGRIRRRFQERRDVSVTLLSELEHVRFPVPAGTFYCFLDVSSCYGTWQGGRQVEGSEALAAHLLEAHGVAVVPGAAFAYDAGIRLSYTVPEPELRAGLTRLVRALRDRC